MREKVNVEVGKLIFTRRPDAVVPILPSIPGLRKKPIICVDPNCKMFISNATDSSGGSKKNGKDNFMETLDITIDDWFERFYFEKNIKDKRDLKKYFLKKDSNEFDDSVDFDTIIDEAEDLLMEPDMDVFKYLNHLKDKGLRDWADEIYRKYLKCIGEFINYYNVIQKKLNYPVIAEKFNEMRSKWGLENEEKNFLKLLEANSKIVCLGNWDINNNEFDLDLGRFIKFINCSPKAFPDVSFILANLLFEESITFGKDLGSIKMEFSFIPLFPKIHIMRTTMGNRVSLEMPFVNNMKTFENFFQLLKIIEDLEIGDKHKEKNKKYSEEWKYDWYYLQKKGLELNQIAGIYNERYGTQLNKDKIHHALKEFKKLIE